MKNKGFTLVELLGVIVVLGIIAVITIPIVQRTILESTEDAYDEQIQSFERGAGNYVASDVYKTRECETKDCSITLKDLQDLGFLPSGEIINPKTDEPFDMTNEVEIYYTSGKFSYEYDITQDEN